MKSAGTTGGNVPADVVKIINAVDAADYLTLEHLLSSGAKPTPAGSPLSPLHAAITHFSDGKLVCDLRTLKLLLDHGADPNFVDRDSGFTALEDALALGDVTCTTLLTKAGASTQSPDQRKESLLEFAVRGAIHTDRIDILQLVLSWGVDPNTQSGERRWTALHEAVWWNNELTVRELLRSGADPCIADSTKQIPLDIAINLKISAPIQNALRGAMQACKE